MEYTKMKNVLASAIEAEIGALFVKCQHRDALSIALTEMGHQKPLAPATTDSEIGDRFLKHNIRKHRFGAIDMRFYWFHGRVIQVN